MSIKSNPRFQYAYGRMPLYCNIDDKVIDETTCGFWFELDGELSAPEYLPTGSTSGRDKNGSCAYKDFVARGWSLEEELRNKFVDQLIDEILAEEECSVL